MSGSVTITRVALTPAEIARQEQERARRERERQIRETFERTISGIRAVTVATARPQGARVEQATERGVSAARGESSTRERGETASRPQRDARAADREMAAVPERDSGQERGIPPVWPPSAPQPDLAALARRLADDARDRGFSQFEEAAESAQDLAALAEIESALDDAIDDADTAALVEAHVDAAAHAVLGTGWTPRPDDDVGRRRVTAAGDTLRSHVSVDEDGSAVVEVAVDARATQINGRASATCGQENLISDAILAKLQSPELEIVEPPAVVRHARTRLGGVADDAKKSAAKGSRRTRRRQVPRS